MQARVAEGTLPVFDGVINRSILATFLSDYYLVSSI
nr:MAG TPA: hypothetical protein [Caudoviricetes sp.]